MEQTDALSSNNNKSSIQTIIKNNIAINNIDIEDLVYLEKDLDFYEKVSILFLLCADDRSKYQRLLQQLVVLASDKTKETDLLRPWAKERTDWKPILLESLCVIQAKRVIHKLGVDNSELEITFVPQNVYTSSHIHPIVKLLYYVCEQLTVEQTRKLITSIQNKYPSVRNFLYTDNGEHLEIYLLNWLWENVISIGQTNGQSSNVPCNLDPITAWLKESELDSIKEKVNVVTSEVNKKISPTTHRMNQTDDKAANAGESSKDFDSLRITPIEPNTAYKIRKSSAGIILIINQKKFYPEPNPAFVKYLPEKPLDTRHGTDNDAIVLQEVFKGFGYETRLENDRTHVEIYEDVQNVINESIRYDSVIVCILSHGFEGVVYGANSIPIKIKDIENLIISDRLIGKPKILIIQACQGKETQKAREIDYLAHDGPTKSLPVYSDYLSCTSTVPGFTSIRHIENGSWFIQTLCDKIKQFSHRKHLVDILTIVNREVLDKRGRDNECMMPIFRSTLRLDLYFPSTK